MKGASKRKVFGLRTGVVLSVGAAWLMFSAAVGASAAYFTAVRSEGALPEGLISHTGRAVPAVGGETGVLSAADRGSLILGRDFSLAVNNASRIGKDQHAAKHLIVDIVYLMDRLEGQREAADLKKVLTKVVKETAGADSLSSEIGVQMKSCRARLKADDRWHFDVGASALGLTLASYRNDETGVRADLTALRNLVQDAPERTSEDVLSRMTGLDRFSKSGPIEDEDYQRIFYAAWDLLDFLAG